MKEKLDYLSAELEIISLAKSDVISTSGDGSYTEGTYEPDGWV